MKNYQIFAHILPNSGNKKLILSQLRKFFFKDNILKIWYILTLDSVADPDFYPSRIPATATKKEGWKFFFVIPFFVATNFTKLKIILFYFLFLKCWRKN